MKKEINKENKKQAIKLAKKLSKLNENDIKKIDLIMTGIELAKK